VSGASASRRWWWWAALVCLVIVAVPTAARATGFEAGPLAMAVAFMPWITVLAVVPLACALLARAWALSAAAGVVLAVCVAWQVPLFTGGSDGEPELTVAAINLRFGEADADQVVALIRDRQVDIVVFTELTPEAESNLRRAGLTKELPHGVSRAEDGFSGTGVWARYPVAHVEALAGFMSQNFSLEVATPSGPITLFAGHPRAPRKAQHQVWDQELAALRDELAAASGPVLVAGDFNTTRDHSGFRAIEALAYADAADQAGSGFAPTFPVGRGLFPPIVIDHVLERASGLVALRTATVDVQGVDHRALIVEYGTQP